MAISREKKEILFEQINRLLQDKKPLILIDYKGLNGKEISLFRRTLSEKESSLKIIKTSLFKKALARMGLTLKEDILNRPMALVFDSDQINLAKMVYEFSKSYANLEILGAVFDHQYAPTSEVKAMALLPTQEELRAHLVQTINLPLLRLGRAFSDLPNRLVLALKYKILNSGG